MNAIEGGLGPDTTTAAMLKEHEPCQHAAWTFRAGWSVCLMCDLKVTDGRGLPRGHFGINGEAMDARRVENHFNCPECGQQIRLKWGDGPDRLECMDGHDISAIGYAVPRKKAEAALWRRQQLQEEGMNIYKTELFPYIAGDSLVGKNVPVVIRGIEAEMIPGERGEKRGYVLYFEKTKKGLILNKTNAKAIAQVFGAETDGWIGKTVILYSIHLKAFGEWHNAARVRVTKEDQNAYAAAHPTMSDEYLQELVDAEYDDWDEDVFADAAPEALTNDGDPGPPDDMEALTVDEFYRVLREEIPWFKGKRTAKIAGIIRDETKSKNPFDDCTKVDIFSTLKQYAEAQA